MPKKLTNLLLVLVSVGLVYGLAEFLVFPLVLPRLPGALFHYFPREVRLPGQTSKAGLLPAPGYLALAGDSYAQGKGDWFIDLGYDRTARFHTPHLLQDALGRDVVTFGRSGAGSVDGLALEPLEDLRALRRLGLAIPDPGCLLLFFYEGNDLSNNSIFLRDHFDRRHPRATLRQPGVFRAFLEETAAVHASGEPRDPGGSLLFGNLLLLSLRDQVWYRLTRNFSDPDPLPPAGTINAAVVGGTLRRLPDRLQGPPLDEPEGEDALFVFEQSVLYIRDMLKDTRCVLVYVPAPLSCYALDGQAQTQGLPDRRFTPEQVLAGSRALAARIRDFAGRHGLDFIDTLPELRAAASQTLIHGPRDWDHFNKAGYEAFARAIAQGLPVGCRAPGGS